MEKNTEVTVVENQLSDTDLQALKASGLTETTIRKVGFKTVSSTEAKVLLGRNSDDWNATGLLIRYPNTDYLRIRPHHPRAKDPSEAFIQTPDWHGEYSLVANPECDRIKYEAPKGEPYRIYLPEGATTQNANMDVPLLLTEGEKKAELLAQLGFAVAGLPGISCWHDSQASKAAQERGQHVRELHPDLVPLCKPGREVIIVFDAPDMYGTNLNTIREAVTLTKALVLRGCKVKIAYIPVEDRITKTGVDDYVVRALEQKFSKELVRSLPDDSLVKLQGQVGLEAVNQALPALPQRMLEKLGERQSATGFVDPRLVEAAFYWATAYMGPGKALAKWAKGVEKAGLVEPDVAQELLSKCSDQLSNTHELEFATLCRHLRDPDTRKKLFGRPGALELDERTEAVNFDRVPLNGDDVILTVKENISKHLRPIAWTRKYEFSSNDIADAIRLVATENKFHPIREYLNGLKWDGVKRLETLHRDVLKVSPGGDQDDALNSIIITKWFVSCVARVMVPGCKVDTVLILAGSQGSLKSTFFATLGKPWFSDSELDIGNKDAYQVLNRAWIYEWPELASMTKARDNNAVKAFVASAKDSYRPPYGRSVIEVDRTTVIVGTTNDRTFLSDTTGNRRYWTIGWLDRVIDIELLEKHRDQYWAEAVHHYRQGMKWYLNAGEEKQLADRNSDFEQDDPWEVPIELYLSRETKLDKNGAFDGFINRPRDMVTVGEVLKHGLQIPPERQTKVMQQRVAAVLTTLGFVKVQKRIDGDKMKVWQRKT